MSKLGTIYTTVHVESNGANKHGAFYAADNTNDYGQIGSIGVLTSLEQDKLFILEVSVADATDNINIAFGRLDPTGLTTEPEGTYTQPSGVSSITIDIEDETVTPVVLSLATDKWAGVSAEIGTIFRANLNDNVRVKLTLA